MISGSTVERARGRWRKILPQLGISPQFLVNKHGPCPLCGGKDRFRFDDKAGTGSYICGQCGAGAGLLLVRKVQNWTYAEACAAIDKIIGTGAPAAQSRQAPEDGPARRRAALERVLAAATDQAVVTAYLKRRGLTGSSPALRGHKALPYYGEGKLICRFPAVVAPILGPDGEMQSVQRIYDADIDPRKMTMPPVSTITGGAVRLHDPVDGDLGVGEGLENCLAARELFGTPTWAALSEGGLQAFVLPAGLKRLRIFADNDGSFVGQAAAFALARRVYRDARHAGLVLDIEVHVPPTADTDWLDVLNARGTPQ